MQSSRSNFTENPSTAIGSEKESNAKRTTPKKRKHRKKTEKKTQFNYCNIPGVHKLVLSELTQRAVGCIAGQNATVEKPWISIDKEAIQEDIELHSESSEFLPIKTEVQDYAGAEILLGYVPDESRDYDEFYVCTTTEACDTAKEIIAKIQKIQDDRLNNAINRKIKTWAPLGSDREVEENMVKLHRPLFEVEIESKYPILPFKVKFRKTKTEQMRDGYMEMRSSDESASNVTKRRIDANIQVHPKMGSIEAQTTFTFPSNSYTQYEYHLPETVTVSSDCRKNIQNFMEQKLDSLDDLLDINGAIDLYSNDYENLVLDPKYTAQIKTYPAREYLSFIDMKLCGNKMISSVSFHPLWTGLAAVSYVDTAPTLYLNAKIKKDEVHRAVHDSNPVLVWSFDNDLKAKLILETPREVYSLSFCPYEENLLVGGCLNGQIIIWDITNKIHRVEKEEILTIHQQKYRDYMHSLMYWMKNIFNISLVRPTAISDLKYSHRGCVNGITWLSPFHNVSKTGKIEETNNKSLQVMTSAEDGTILIWDLLKKPVTTPGGFKAIRKLKRLKKRPSALLVDESPFKILHLNLKPIYRINIGHVLENHRILAISSFFSRFFDTNYDFVSDKRNLKDYKMSDRLFYTPKLDKELTYPRKTFWVGTMEGDFIQGTWEGQEFDSGEMVNFEDCHFVSYGQYHDGPVVSMDYNHCNNTIMTVGGRIFAFWHENFPNRPILWRKSKSIYTNGAWFFFEQATVKVVRVDGYVEMWQLFYKSKEAISVTLSSNGAVSEVVTHPRRLKSNVMGLCDYRGCFKLHLLHHELPGLVQSKQDYMKTFLENEMERKKEFTLWQTEWNRRYSEWVALQKSQIEESTEPVFEEKKPTKEPKKKIPKVSPGERYLEHISQEHAAKEQERIKEIILDKKQLDTDQLYRLREPLRKLEEENEFKKRKQKTKHKESDKIFKDTVAMLFPDIVREKPQPPPDPYRGGNSFEVITDSFHGYHRLSREAQDYVEEHPFQYDFNWLSVLKTGRFRRKKLDDGFEKATHKNRFMVYKEERNDASVKNESPKGSKVITIGSGSTVDFGEAEEEAEM